MEVYIILGSIFLVYIIIIVFIIRAEWSSILKKICTSLFFTIIYFSLVLYSLPYIALSLTKRYVNEIPRELSDGYNGIVLDTNKLPIKNVKVKLLHLPHKQLDTLIFTCYTDENGFFKFKHGFDSLLFGENDKLMFEHEDYAPYTVSNRFSYGLGYRPKYDEYAGYYFIFKIPDTLILREINTK